MSELHDLVYIFIRQIDPTVVGNFAINDQNLPMIPVIVNSGHKRCQRGKYMSVDSYFFKAIPIITRQCTEFIRSIVDYAY